MMDLGKKRIMLDMMLTDRDSLILSKLDTDQMVEQITKTGADSVVVWFKDENGYCYYNTEYGPRHPNLGDTDFSGEMVSKLKAKGIGVIAYYIVGLDWNYSKTHPEHQLVFSDGLPGTYLFPCLNSPYRDYVIAQTTEIVKNYDVDGIWLDCIFYPPKGFFPDPDAQGGKKISDAISCFCSRCRRKYYEETGRTYPDIEKKDTKEWLDWIVYREKQLSYFIEQLCSNIRKTDPQVMITHNMLSFQQHDWRGGNTWKNEKYYDWLTAEAYYPWMGHLHTSILPRLFKAIGDDKPFDICTLTYARLWDFTIKPMDQLLADAMTTVSHGGAVMVDDHVTAYGTLVPAMYDRIKTMFERVDRVNPYCRNTKSINYAAVIYSERSKNYYAKGVAKDYQASFDGACRALIDSKLPFDVIMDEKITYDMLLKYKVIVMSNVACLSQDAAKIIDNACKAGVGIVASYETGLYYEDGTKREDFVIKCLGVQYLRKMNYPHAFIEFTPADGWICRDIAKSIPFNINKPYIEAKGNVGIGTVYKPAVWACNHHYRYYENPPGEKTSMPAIWTNGNAIYIPCDVGGTYAEYTIPEAKHILINSILEAGGTPDIFVNANLSVEAVYTCQEDENRIIVHLINYPSAPLRTAQSGGVIDSDQVVEEIPEVSNILIHLNTKRWDVYSANSLELGMLDYDKINGKVILPKLHIHDVIIFEYK